MLGDLLPLPVGRAKLRLTLPAGWQSVALAKPAADGRYEFAQAESSVIFIGRELRQQQARAGATEFTLATTGDWAFADEDAARLVQDILREHARGPGTSAQPVALVLIAPFPRQGGPQEWSAETRGATVVLLTGREPGKTAALAQLSQPLAHELFHLWVPNGLTLAGDYAWFFEGFTLYQAERAGVRLGLLSFQNYLDNMAPAFDQSNRTNEGTGLSLLAASQRRWSDTDAVVYRKGMLVAYLYDLMLREQTKGKRSLDDVYRALFSRGGTATKADANTIVCELLTRTAGDPSFVERYIKHGGAIDLAAAIKPFGLALAPGGARTHIVVAPELSRAQRHLLKQIGYNEQAGVSVERAAALTARLVGELPGEHRGVVVIRPPVERVAPQQNVLDPRAVRPLRLLRGEELVVLLAAVPHQVLVHRSEGAPIVDEHHDELQVALRGGGQHVVQPLEAVRAVVVGGATALGGPILKVEAVLVPHAVRVGDATVQRAAIHHAPDAQHFEAEPLRRVQQVVHHGARLVDGIVVVRAREAERLALELE